VAKRPTDRAAERDSCAGSTVAHWSCALAHQLIDEIWTKRRPYQQRYNPKSVALLEALPYSSAPEIRQNEGFDDLKWRVYQVQTTCTDQHELESQRWLVRGLLDSEFQLRRHEAANAMSIVYGLSHQRSRTLHDQIMLEVRRQLLGVVEVPEIDVSCLCGTRGFALARYAEQLSGADFSKLAFLMRNLSPTALIIAGHLDWVLNGYPGSRLLFDEQ
jgi:hypothetical protein